MQIHSCQDISWTCICRSKQVALTGLLSSSGSRSSGSALEKKRKLIGVASCLLLVSWWDLLAIGFWVLADTDKRSVLASPYQEPMYTRTKTEIEIKTAEALLCGCCSQPRCDDHPLQHSSRVLLQGLVEAAVDGWVRG